MSPIPAAATLMASSATRATRSPSRSQASPAAKNGPVASRKTRFATVVSSMPKT